MAIGNLKTYNIKDIGLGIIKININRASSNEKQ